MASVYPLTPAELLLRRDLGTHGDVGNELHAKLDRSKSDTEAILTDTADIQPKIGAPATGTLAGDIIAAQADIDLIATDVDSVLTELGNSTYGLSALEVKLMAVDTVVDNTYSLIGAPAGVSVSADVAAIKAETALIKTDTTNLINTIGTPAYGTVVADIADIASKVGGIQNNTRTTVAILDELELPPTGQTYFYRIQLNNFDTAGNMEAPDSPPTVAVVSFAGTSRTGNLVDDAGGPSATMILDSEGRYHIRYKVTDAHAVNEGLLFTFDIIEGGVTRKIDRVARVVEEISSTFTSTDRSNLGDILTDTADMQPKLGTPAGASISADIASIQSGTNSIESKVDILDTNVDAVVSELDIIESKDTGLTFDRSTDSLEAIREKLDTFAAAAASPAAIRATKASGSLAQGASEVVNLGISEGVNTSDVNIKEIRVVPSTQTSTNFTVEVFEDSAATLPLLQYTGAKANQGDLRLALDLVFMNRNSTVSKNIYVKVTNVADSSSSVFNVEVRGVALQDRSA